MFHVSSNFGILISALLLGPVGCGTVNDNLDSLVVVADDAEISGDIAVLEAESSDGPTDSEDSVSDASYMSKEVQPIGLGGTYEQRCERIAAGICGHAQNCCSAEAPSCYGEILKHCLDGKKYSPLVELAKSGKAILNTELAVKCDAALADLGGACSQLAFELAYITCLLAWTDPAALGEPCVDSHEEICAGGAGRCLLGLCRKAGDLGESCGSLVPCKWGSFCAPDGSAVCASGGSMCGLFGFPGAEDIYIGCPVGQKCLGKIASTCSSDDGSPAGTACSSGESCKVDHKCTDGACVPGFCQNWISGK